MCFRDCSSHGDGTASLHTALLNQTVNQLLILTSKGKFYFLVFSLLCMVLICTQFRSAKRNLDNFKAPLELSD